LPELAAVLNVETLYDRVDEGADRADLLAQLADLLKQVRGRVPIKGGARFRQSHHDRAQGALESSSVLMPMPATSAPYTNMCFAGRVLNATPRQPDDRTG